MMWCVIAAIVGGIVLAAALVVVGVAIAVDMGTPFDGDG